MANAMSKDTPPKTSITAITTQPAINELVISLAMPMMLGLTKPPNKPMLLIKAMPPAAAEPFKYLDGMAQKMVYEAHINPVATAIAMNAKVKLLSATTETMSNAAAATAARTLCHLRSCILSEVLANTIMNTALNK